MKNEAKEQMEKAMKAMGEACLAVMKADLCSDDCPFRLYCFQKIDEEPHIWETWDEFKERLYSVEED